jgi:hypothetical protein
VVRLLVIPSPVLATISLRLLTLGLRLRLRRTRLRRLHGGLPLLLLLLRLSGHDGLYLPPRIHQRCLRGFA